MELMTATLTLQPLDISADCHLFKCHLANRHSAEEMGVITDKSETDQRPFLTQTFCLSCNKLGCLLLICYFHPTIKFVGRASLELEYRILLL